MTQDALRPRSDAGRGDEVGCGICRSPRVNSWEDDWGTYGERDATALKFQPQDGAVRATQPYDCHRRTACVETATQPRDGCAADVVYRPGCRACTVPVAGARLDQGIPSFEPASGERCSTPRPVHAAGRRLSLVERRRESRARSVRPLRVGDGPSRFLGTKRWKKPETDSIIAPPSGIWKG